MKTVRMAVAVGGLCVLVVAGATAVAQTTAPNPVEQLTQAKAVFERACVKCHSLDKPLSKTFDKAGWEKTLERMRTNGAKVSAEEAAQVVAYLLAKNTFEAKCSACHPTDKPLGKNKSAAEWQATVQKMSAKKPGHIAEAEATDIAAYLSLVRPVQK